MGEMVELEKVTIEDLSTFMGYLEGYANDQ